MPQKQSAVSSQQPATPRVVVCIASHERSAPLRIVLRCLPPEWHALIVVSTAKDAADVHAIGRANTTVHEFPNDIVGAKWQHAVDRARALEPDLLAITGSDDCLIADTAQLVKTMHGHDMLALNSFHIFDGKQHYKCGYRSMVVPIGGGRFYSRALLDKMRWRLFDTTKNRGLDDFGYWNAQRNGARILIADDHAGLRVVGLKGPWPMYNSMAKLQAARNIIMQPLPGLKCFGDYTF